MNTILSTKKLKKAAKKKLSDANFNVIEEKFIKTKTIDFTIETVNKFVIFTSKNSVKSILKNENESLIKEKKIFCVGQKTKKFLKKNHFTVQETADYASDLGLIIIEKYKNHSFTFFSGNIRKNTLPDILNENNIKWDEVVTYETTLSPKKITSKVDGILFFSPSSIESYFTKNTLENETCFCIGTTTAKALENRTKNIKIAAQPTVKNVIEEVVKYYK